MQLKCKKDIQEYLCFLDEEGKEEKVWNNNKFDKKLCDSSVMFHKETTQQKALTCKKITLIWLWNICRNYCSNNPMSNCPEGISIPTLLKTFVRSLEAFKEKSDLCVL